VTPAPCPYRGEVERLRAVITQAIEYLEYAPVSADPDAWNDMARIRLREASPAVDRTPGT
jgi:hypothetical protein